MEPTYKTNFIGKSVGIVVGNDKFGNAVIKTGTGLVATIYNSENVDNVNLIRGDLIKCYLSKSRKGSLIAKNVEVLKLV